MWGRRRNRSVQVDPVPLGPKAQWPRRPMGRGSAQVVSEAAATVQGTITDTFGDGWPLPPWAWLNKLAHASWTDLGQLAQSRPRRARGWEGAITFLAGELLSYARTPDRLLQVQRTGLIPLELDLLGRQLPPPATPLELVSMVRNELERAHRYNDR